MQLWRHENTFDGTIVATYGKAGGNTNILATNEYNDLEADVYTCIQVMTVLLFN